MDKKKQKNTNNKKITEMAQTLRQEKFNGPVSDILGSYTGTPVDGDMPEQDADDL